MSAPAAAPLATRAVAQAIDGLCGLTSTRAVLWEATEAVALSCVDMVVVRSARARVLAVVEGGVGAEPMDGAQVARIRHCIARLSPQWAGRLLRRGCLYDECSHARLGARRLRFRMCSPDWLAHYVRGAPLRAILRTANAVDSGATVAQHFGVEPAPPCGDPELAFACGLCRIPRAARAQAASWHAAAGGMPFPCTGRRASRSPRPSGTPALVGYDTPDAPVARRRS